MKVMHINCHYKVGSTGKIIDDINKELDNENHEYFVSYSLGERSAAQNAFKIAYKYETAFYKRLSYIFGMQYSIAIIPTLRLFKVLRKINPNIVHLHSINAFTVNIYMLLNHLNKKNIKIVITNHAEFFYTGNCSYSYECNRWMSGCGDCPRLEEATNSKLFDTTAYAWKLMKKAFQNEKRAKVVSVSSWVGSRASKSPIMKNHEHLIIENGIDTNAIFKKEAVDLILKNKYQTNDEKIILHVTSSFTDDKKNIKGGRFIIDLAKELKDYNIKIIVISSFTKKMNLPTNIVSVGKVSSPKELAAYYNMADLTVITSKKETFSMPVAESLACGTPVVGFKAGGPETIALKEFSEFVDYGDVASLKRIIMQWINRKEKYSEKLSSIASVKYSRKRMAEEYINLYKKLMQ